MIQTKEKRKKTRAMETDLKTKSVLVIDNGLFVEVAIMLTRYFGKVGYHCWNKGAFPKPNASLIGTGIEGLHVLVNLWDHIDNYDLIVFPDVYDGDLCAYLRRKGKLVWGSGKGEAIELYRWQTKQLFRELGLPVQHVERVIGIDSLRDYIKEHKVPVWVKVSRFRGATETFQAKNYEAALPKLDELQYTLGAAGRIMEFIVEDEINGGSVIETGYDGYCIDGGYPTIGIAGFEIKDEGYVCAVKPYSELPEEVRLVNSKIAPWMKDRQYRNFFSTEIRIPEDGKPYCIDPCFSSDTEILTEDGWKLFQDLSGTESVATLNPITKEIEYHVPTDHLCHPYDGNMVNITSPKGVLDLLVTPNHGVWRTDRHGNGLWVEEASKLTDKGFIPRTGTWKGDNPEFFVLPSYFNRWISGKGKGMIKEKFCPAIKIDTEDWVRFMAIYISDGSLHSRWAVNITQYDDIDGIDSILCRLPFNYTRCKSGFVIHSVQLNNYLQQFGHCHDKFVPKFIKTLTPELIKRFLDAYLMTDGMEHKGQKLYFTCSPRLAGDIQELVLKIGSVADVVTRKTKGTLMVAPSGKTYTRRYDTFVIGQRDTFNRYWFETGSRRDLYFKPVEYHGMVYDVTVQNHTVFVRRNGKAAWSSNCARAGSPPNEIYQELFDNWGEIIWKGAQGILVDPHPVAKFGCMVMVHSMWANNNLQHVKVPNEIRRFLKFRNFCKIDGENYVVPMGVGLPEIGAVIGIGQSLDQAVEHCLENVELCESENWYQADFKKEAIEEGIAEAKKGESKGITIL